jgi:hypothetical protein
MIILPKKDPIMLGELIAQLNRPDVTDSVLMTLDADLREQIERRAAATSMPVADFAAGAVHEFVERAGDELWFQMLTIIRKSADPGLAAIQTILEWTVTEPPSTT